LEKGYELPSSLASSLAMISFKGSKYENLMLIVDRLQDTGLC
jgi:hypothetical protein